MAMTTNSSTNVKARFDLDIADFDIADFDVVDFDIADFDIAIPIRDSELRNVAMVMAPTLILKT
jgi:hypothetical protein